MTVLPLIAFFVLIAAGLWLGELDTKRALVFVAIWAGGLIVFNALGVSRLVFVPVEVVLDGILVFMIFGGDVRIR